MYPESEEPNEALVHSIARLPELQEVLADATDLGLAALVENDMLDAIPIVAWVRRFAKGGIAIRDALRSTNEPCRDRVRVTIHRCHRNGPLCRYRLYALAVARSGRPFAGGSVCVISSQNQHRGRPPAP